MLTANNALGFAIRNKVFGLNQLRQDRNIVNNSFDLDIEDDINYDNFFLSGKRLGNSAEYVFNQVKQSFKRSPEKPKSVEGIEVKQLRPGQKGDIAWLKATENEMLQSNGKILINKVPSYKTALVGSLSRKSAVKVEDTEFNGEQKEYPKMRKLNNGKWLIEKELNSGVIKSSALEAIEVFQSFGGKVVIND